LNCGLPVATTATQAKQLGFRAQGHGRVWLDAVELRWGPPYRDRPLPGTESHSYVHGTAQLGL
jgi:hypothetical protein